MKDLDFDELDKAVNSLMASKSNDVPAEHATSATPDTPQPVETTSSSESESQQVQVAQPGKPKTLGVKRSGRFMDVVHPSSDMRTTQKPTMPSRVGVTLSPISHPETSETAVDDTPDEALAAEPQTTDWPDPIDMHQSTPAANDTELEPVAAILDDEEPMTQPEVEPTTKPAADSSEMTPFLPDAKVEKRPLGGIQSDEAAVAEEATTDGDTDLPGVNPENQLPHEPLQAELKNDIVAIESDTTTDETEPSDSKPATTRKSEETTQVPAVQSITQQYKPQPSSGDASHAALYDGAAEGLAHPPKKKSGWLAVFIVLLLIALGAGGAAALYFLGYI